MSGCASGQPLSQPGDWARAVGDDPEGDIDSAASVFRWVVRAAPELGGTPIPGDDHAAEQARQARVFGEADNDVQVSDSPAAAQVMLGAALREGDDAHPVPPARQVWVAGEERVEFSVRGAPQPSEVGLVEALVRAHRIAVSAFTMRHVEADITGYAIPGPSCHTSPLAFPHHTAADFVPVRLSVVSPGVISGAHAGVDARWNPDRMVAATALGPSSPVSPIRVAALVSASVAVRASRSPSATSSPARRLAQNNSRFRSPRRAASRRPMMPWSLAWACAAPWPVMVPVAVAGAGGGPARSAIHRGKTGSWCGWEQTWYRGEPGQVPR